MAQFDCACIGSAIKR